MLYVYVYVCLCMLGGFVDLIMGVLEFPGMKHLCSRFPWIPGLSGIPEVIREETIGFL